MTLAPWRSPLSRALHRNRALPHARYVQLATVQPDGTPANRTVVFRGFVAEEDDLQFVSDRRSDKMADLQHQPMAALCWYFPKTREQFRLSGMVHVITQDTPDVARQALRTSLWQALSDNARLQFAWPTPGQMRVNTDAFELPPPDDCVPLPDFCVLTLGAIAVDHLELRGDPQNRWRYAKDEAGTWSQQAVNP